MRKPSLDDLRVFFYHVPAYTVGIIFLIGIFVEIAGLPDPDGAYDVLETNGYSAISITGRRFFGCGESDVFRTGFSAKSPNGQWVTGVVCKGIFKGHTIRFD